jgi:hypothetical protein
MCRYNLMVNNENSQSLMYNLVKKNKKHFILNKLHSYDLKSGFGWISHHFAETVIIRSQMVHLVGTGHLNTWPFENRTYLVILIRPV